MTHKLLRQALNALTSLSVYAYAGQETSDEETDAAIAALTKALETPTLDLAYLDCEDTSPEGNCVNTVSGYIAGTAYNDLCRMIGGAWPDAKLQNEAPIAHEFFMALFTSDSNITGVEPESPVMRQVNATSTDKEAFEAFATKSLPTKDYHLAPSKYPNGLMTYRTPRTQHAFEGFIAGRRSATTLTPSNSTELDKLLNDLANMSTERDGLMHALGEQSRAHQKCLKVLYKIF